MVPAQIMREPADSTAFWETHRAHKHVKVSGKRPAYVVIPAFPQLTDPEFFPQGTPMNRRLHSPKLV